MLNIKMSTKGSPVFTFSLPEGRLAPAPPPVNYATARRAGIYLLFGSLCTGIYHGLFEIVIDGI